MAGRKKNQLTHFNYKKLLSPFVKQRTRAVVNPFVHQKPVREGPSKTQIYVYDYSKSSIQSTSVDQIEECYPYLDTSGIAWINMDGIDKTGLEKISAKYNIHSLIQEDILSYGERPKMDEVENILFVLLNMLYYNKQTTGVEQEQISIVLGKNFVISFQEDASRDVFDPIREKLKLSTHKIRLRGADYLFYSLIDIIVDSYFTVIEKIGERIELAEEQLTEKVTQQTFQNIIQLRKELILLKRNTGPVRDLLSALMRSESELLDDNTIKYFKDVYDHIVQANDLTENYRDMVMSLQDLYLNTVNLKMNDVMKTLAIVTTVMAPATVIGGIFGMNFDVIPYTHQQWGFYVTVSSMIIIPILMIFWFRKRGWFQRNLPHDDENNGLFF